jgi:hypothetical protein
MTGGVLACWLRADFLARQLHGPQATPAFLLNSGKAKVLRGTRHPQRLVRQTRTFSAPADGAPMLLTCLIPPVVVAQLDIIASW